MTASRRRILLTTVPLVAAALALGLLAPGVARSATPPPAVVAAPGPHPAAPPDASPAPLREASASDLAFYTCAMHPTVRLQAPGHCPICAMDLVAVTRAQVASGEILVDPARQQQLGIRTALVARGALHPVVRALGRVAYDEAAQVDVALKFAGWVTRLDANATGMRVAQGQALLSVYSPELYAAEQDYLLARQGRAADDGLVRAARQRLSLWDLDDARIAALEQAGTAAKDTVITAPTGGLLIAKDVVQGAAFTPGQRLFRIAPTARVWVLADVLASDLPLVRVGQPATVALSFVPGATFAGAVDYLYPGLDADTRSVRARVVIADPGERLRPDMFAEVTIAADPGEHLLVPRSAVIYTGPRRLVFTDLGEGRLRPVVVTLGQADADAVEVLGGLKEGDRVVTSGTFLIAAESRIRSAEQFWGGGDDAR
jgi:Cu(I)/Ag(I) efflux system membrane fusion protein